MKKILIVVVIAFFSVSNHAQNQRALNEISGPWKTGTFVDDFGDETDEKYIYTLAEGDFSNSATTDENLYVKIIVKKTMFGIFLHEYSRSRPAEKFIGTGTISLKNESNDIIKLYSGHDWGQQGGIAVYYENAKKLRDFIKKSNGFIKIIIKDDYSSSYSFEIDADGFTKALNSL